MIKSIYLALAASVITFAPAIAKNSADGKVEAKAPEKVAYQTETKINAAKADPTDAGMVKVREEFKHMRPVSDFSISVY
jgi:hypothetical protein